MISDAAAYRRSNAFKCGHPKDPRNRIPTGPRGYSTCALCARARKIVARVDAALERLDERGMEVRAIYLDEVDRAALDQVMSRHYGSTLTLCEFRDHPLRSGKTSMIYSTHGVSVSIAKGKRPQPQCADIPRDQVIQCLDELSRERALSLEESLTLERAIKGKPISKREAARLGVKRKGYNQAQAAA
jgi:hypothetical protein